MSRLLLVEDDRAIGTVLQEVLIGAGHSVRLAESGAAALATMREQVPELIVLDLMLPDMNGWTFLRERGRLAAFATVPVLVVTAAGPAGAAHAQELGAPVILAKPFDIDVLLTHVQRLLEGGSVRQCAWCHRVADHSGSFRVRTKPKLRWATHGICPECKAREWQELLN